MWTFIEYLMIFVQVVVGFLLIGVILLQKSKSQGMGMAFGSGMGESLFGSQVGNVLTKITVVLAFVFLVNSGLLAYLKGGRGPADTSVTDLVPDAPPKPAPAMPSGPAYPEEAPADTPAWDDAVPAQEPLAVPDMPAPEAGELPSVEIPLDAPAAEVEETEAGEAAQE